MTRSTQAENDWFHVSRDRGVMETIRRKVISRFKNVLAPVSARCRAYVQANVQKPNVDLVGSGRRGSILSFMFTMGAVSDKSRDRASKR